MRHGWTAMALMLAGCGGGGAGGGTGTTPAPTPTATPTPTPVASSERDIAPATADPRVTDPSVHVAINPGSTVAAKGRLFVMLPGTGGPPRAYRLILRSGAARGYHAIGLSYPNDLAVGDACPPSPDPDCAGNMRREIVLGEDRSPLVAVDAPASIVGRLTALLTYLARTAPTEGWEQYLVGGQPDWARITAGGHSQGSGHAGYMAKLYLLGGVAMFSGPGDLGLGGRSLATWLSLPPVTPPARLYALIHRDDERVPAGLAQGVECARHGEFRRDGGGRRAHRLCRVVAHAADDGRAQPGGSVSVGQPVSRGDGGGFRDTAGLERRAAARIAMGLCGAAVREAYMMGPRSSPGRGGGARREPRDGGVSPRDRGTPLHHRASPGGAPPLAGED